MASASITPWEVHGEKEKTVIDFLFLGSKITVDSDCSHKIKRHLLFGRKAMTNLDSILKKRRHHFAHKGLYSQSYSMDVRIGPYRRLSIKELMLSKYDAGEDS